MISIKGKPITKAERTESVTLFSLCEDPVTIEIAPLPFTFLEELEEKIPLPKGKMAPMVDPDYHKSGGKTSSKYMINRLGEIALFEDTRSKEYQQKLNKALMRRWTAAGLKALKSHEDLEIEIEQAEGETLEQYLDRAWGEFRDAGMTIENMAELYAALLRLSGIRSDEITEKKDDSSSEEGGPTAI